MNVRMNVGFNNSRIKDEITLASQKQKISKSDFIEKTIRFYFEHHKKSKIKLVTGISAKKNNRLNIIFKDEFLVLDITHYAKKNHLSKSQLIGYILDRYFEEHHVDTTTQTYFDYDIKKYFEFNIKQYVVYAFYENYRGKTFLCDSNVKHQCMSLNIHSNSLSLADLNKAYSKKIKSQLIYESELHNEKIIHSGLCYVVLIKEACLMKQVSLMQIESPNKIGPYTKKNKRVYFFEIHYLILLMGKITRKKIKDSYQLSIMPFDRNAVLKKKSNYIDLASIEYVSRNQQSNYQIKPNYYRLLPKLIGDNCSYYIKVQNKPKAVSQLLKKNHIYKIDTQSKISLKPLAKEVKFLDSKKLIVNILPIYEYTKHKYFEEEKFIIPTEIDHEL